MRTDNVVVAAARVAAGQATSPLLGVNLSATRWQAVLKIEGTNTYFGTFDREKDAGLAVDWVLKNILGRPDDVNYRVTTTLASGPGTIRAVFSWPPALLTLWAMRIRQAI